MSLTPTNPFCITLADIFFFWNFKTSTIDNADRSSLITIGWEECMVD